jgi:hypothetical protein
MRWQGNVSALGIYNLFGLFKVSFIFCCCFHCPLCSLCSLSIVFNHHESTKKSSPAFVTAKSRNRIILENVVLAWQRSVG